MHDPMTLVYGCRLFDVWHVDPERDGTDDSCGWFPRSRHGDKAVLEKIVKRFEFDWDRVFVSKPEDDDEPGEVERIYARGYFYPSGKPRLSPIGIALNFFWLAAIETLGTRDKADRFVQRHLLEILIFAENTFDSLHDSIALTFGGAPKREERIRDMASIIYAWVFRNSRPWYRHPRWHVNHWKINVKPYKMFLRWAFTRCMKCGKRVGWTWNVVGHQWHSDGPQWFKSEQVDGPCCSGAVASAPHPR